MLCALVVSFLVPFMKVKESAPDEVVEALGLARLLDERAVELVLLVRLAKQERDRRLGILAELWNR